MNIETLLKEQSEYLAAIYFILFTLQIREFKRSDDPLGAAIVTAGNMRRNLLNTGSVEESTSQLVVELFDEIVAALQSRTLGPPDRALGWPIRKGSA